MENQFTINDFKKLIDEHRQVFLTGPAGTGKSFTVNMIKNKFRNPILLSSTNSGAIEIEGDTVHSFFRLGLSKNREDLRASDNSFVKWFMNNVTPNVEKARHSLTKVMDKALGASELLIIDEVSMISGELLDLIYYRLQSLGYEYMPILFVGDLFQLPPVKSKTMIFESEHWKPKIIELTEIKRTNDLNFATAQKYMRVGKYTERAHNILKEMEAREPHKSAVFILPTNKKVDDMNEQKLEELDTEYHTFTANIQGNMKIKDQFLKDCPVDERITLKEKCRVIIVGTDTKEKRFVNGDSGTFMGFINNSLLVNLDRTGQTIAIERIDFSKKKIQIDEYGDPELVDEITMTQYPLRVGYAITVHRSQGKSLEAVHINCNGFFESSQFYVAVSRGKEPSKVSMRGFKRSLLNISPKVKSYYDNNKENILRITEVHNPDDLSKGGDIDTSVYDEEGFNECPF